MAAAQFSLLTLLGLRQDHYFLDVGCGSLRAGRLFIAYLEPDRYYGVEPEEWLIEEGIAQEVGQDLVDIKRPVFSDTDDFDLTAFDQQFDYILAQSVFSHAALPQIERCLTEVKQSMAPEGLFAATFVQGDEDYEGDSWVYPGCVGYSLETMRDLAADIGLASEPIDWHHGAQQKWLVYSHRDNVARLPALGDAARTLSLEYDLRMAKARLAKLERHPYVKLGMRVVSHPLYTRILGGSREERKAA
jgi:SAM-dependent methyltransferase